MLGEAALAHQHLTAPADAPAAADGIDIDAELAGAVEQARANGKTPPLARGGENDIGAFHHDRASGAGGLAQLAQATPADRRLSLRHFSPWRHGRRLGRLADDGRLSPGARGLDPALAIGVVVPSPHRPL